MKPNLGNSCSSNGMVSKFIGSDFDYVKQVVDNIGDIKKVSNSLNSPVKSVINTTIPDISNCSVLVFTNTLNITLDSFTGTSEGKQFTVMFDGKVTIVSGSNIKLKGGGTKVPIDGELIVFQCNPLGVDPKVIQVGGSE